MKVRIGTSGMSDSELVGRLIELSVFVDKEDGRGFLKVLTQAIGVSGDLTMTGFEHVLRDEWDGGAGNKYLDRPSEQAA